MSPIPLNRAERAALLKLVRLKGSCDRRRLSDSRAERLVRHGLLTRTPAEYHLTLRGQLEVLRQRFRRMHASRRAVTITDATGTLLSDEALG